MIGTTQSIYGRPNVSNSAQSLRRYGRSFIWKIALLVFRGRMQTTTIHSVKGIWVSLCPLQIQGDTVAIALSKIKRTDYLGRTQADATIEALTSVEHPPREPPLFMTKQKLTRKRE